MWQRKTAASITQDAKLKKPTSNQRAKLFSHNEFNRLVLQYLRLTKCVLLSWQTAPMFQKKSWLKPKIFVVLHQKLRQTK